MAKGFSDETINKGKIVLLQKELRFLTYQLISECNKTVPKKPRIETLKKEIFVVKEGIVRLKEKVYV